MQTVSSRLTAVILFLLSSLPITANIDPFSFIAIKDAQLNTLITSNIATISGFDSTASVRIEGGSYIIGNSTPTKAEGAITAGGTITIEVLSSSEFNTQTFATLTVVSGASPTTVIFSVTTRLAPSTPVFTSNPITTVIVGSLYQYRLSASDDDSSNLVFSVAPSTDTELPSWLDIGVVVTTLAGDVLTGDDDGVSSTAKFRSPSDVAIDASGNIIIADRFNHLIRKLDPDGIVSTVAGANFLGFADGASATAVFAFPFGVAIDASGNIIVADTNNHRIRSIAPNGIVSTIAGSETNFIDGASSTARFNAPTSVVTDASGNIIVADTNNHRIRSIALDGTVTTIAGTGPRGFGNGSFVDGASATARFSNPFSAAIGTSGNIIVTDRGNHRIRSISSDGIVSTIAGSGDEGFADGASATAKFDNPTGVAVDAGGNIIVTDSNNRIRSIAPDGIVSTIAGSDTGSTDGLSSDAKFFRPVGIAIDASDNIIIADQNNSRIRKIDRNNVILAGTPSCDDVGIHNLALIVSDGELQSSQSFTIRVMSDGSCVLVAPFSFDVVNDVALGATITSGAITIATNTQDPQSTFTISIEGSDARYSINDGSYTDLSGVVNIGDSVRVQIVASNQLNTTKTATISIDNIIAAFTITTTNLMIIGGDSTASYNDPPITISATSSDITTIAITWTSSATSVVSFSDPNIGLITIVGAGSALITAMRGDNEDSIIFIVEPLTLTPTFASPQTFIYNTNIRTVLATITSGIVGTDDVSLSTSGATATDAGNYNIGLALIGAASPNYRLSVDTLSWSITKANQTGFTIMIGSFLKLEATTTTTASGGQSTGAISFTSSNPTVATITQDGIISAQSLGTTTISATRAGDSNYNDISASTLLEVVLDITPDPFSFTAIINGQLNALITSNIVPITGFDSTLSIHIEGGSYTIGASEPTAAEGVITAGATITVQVLSSNEFDTQTVATLTVGSGASATRAIFSVTTRLDPAITPNSITLTLSATTTIADNTITVTVSASNSSGAIDIAELVATVVLAGAAVSTNGNEITYTPSAAGNETISVISINGIDVSGISGSSATFEVTHGALTRIELEPQNPTFLVNGVDTTGVTITVTLYDANNNLVLTDTAIRFAALGGGGFETKNGRALSGTGTVEVLESEQRTGIVTIVAGAISATTTVTSVEIANIGFVGISNTNTDSPITITISATDSVGDTIDISELEATVVLADASILISSNQITYIPSIIGTETISVTSINGLDVSSIIGSSATFNITRSTLTRIELEPSPQTIIVNYSAIASVTLFGINNNLFLAPTTLTVNIEGPFTISSTTIISSAGRAFIVVEAIAVGVGTLTISINDIFATTTITAVEPLIIIGGDITAIYGDDAISITSQGGNSIQPITWTSSIPTVATIDENSGVVTIIDIGTTTITASRGSSQASISLLVNPRQLGLSVGPTDTLVFNNTNQTIAVSLTNAVEDDINSSAITLTISGDQTAINAGNYQFSVSISGSASPNYIFAPTTITWTIDQAEQSSFAFNPPNSIPPIQTLDLSAFITGASSTADVIYTISLDSGSASINNSTLTAISVGSISISAISPEDVNYLEASITADINIFDISPFTLATSSIILSKNSPNTTRHIVAITDIVADGGVAIQQATLTIDIVRVGDNIFTENPQPVVSFATDSIQTSASLTATPTSAKLYFSIAADATGSASLVITLNKAEDGQDSSKTLIVTVQDSSNTAPIIIILDDDDIRDFSVFGGHVYGITRFTRNYNSHLTAFDSDGGYLARVESAAELAHIRGLLPSGGFYLGANDIASEGDWVYANDGTQFGVDVFSGNGGFVVYPGFLNIFEFGLTDDEPNNFGEGEDCLEVRTNSITDSACSTFFRGVFEFPSGLPAATNLGRFDIPFNTTSPIIIADNLLGFDLDGDDIVWSATDSGAGGSVVITTNTISATATISYQPAPDFYGNITLTVSLNEVVRTDRRTSAVAMINVRSLFPSLVTPTAQVLSVGKPSSLTIINNGEAPSAFSITPALPASLSIVLVSGNFIISGTPIMTQQSTTYTLSASNAAGTGTISFVISINLDPFMIVEGDITVTYGDNISLTTNIPGSTWTSSAPAIASIDPNTGVVSTTGVGSAIITASNDVIRGAGGEGEASITLIVTAREITATIGDTSFMFDNTTRTVATTLNNILASDADDITLIINGTSAAIDVGTYTFIIGIGGSASPNYIISPTTITWTISRGQQTDFIFIPPESIPLTPTLDLSAFIIGALDTADVIYTIGASSGSASISNSILSPISVGSISISAISPGGTNYLETSITADINIVDTLAFTLATHSIILSKNSPNTIRHIVAITDIATDASTTVQGLEFSIARVGDNIFTENPQPVISFATNIIQTDASVTIAPVTATLYFTIAPDATGSAGMVITSVREDGQRSTQTLVVTVKDSNQAPVISAANALEDISVFGGHLYGVISSGSYNTLLNDFDAEGGYLVRVESAAELGHIRALFPGPNDRFYLGANDIASEGDWVYTNDGAQFGVDTDTGAGGFVVYPGFLNIFAFARTSEPNNNDGRGGSENCLEATSNDVVCSGGDVIGAVFEFPSGLPATANLGTVDVPFGPVSAVTIIRLFGFDLDGDDVVWSATDSGAGGNIDIIGITSSIVDISYQLAPDFHGNITLTINLNEVGLTNGASAVMMINVVNPTPALVAPSAQVLLAGEPVELTIVNNGGVPTTFDITPTLPVSLSINEVGGNIVISGTPIIAQQSTTYTLSTSNAVGTNTISFVISINIDPLSIVGGDITAIYGDDAISITSQGGNSTQPITWASSTPTVATIDENSGVVTIIDIGTTTIIASRGSSQASINLLVNPRQLGLSVGPTDTLVFNNTSQTIAVSLTNAVEDDINSGAISLTISGDQTAINAGNYQFSVSISGSASPNYIFSPTTITWTINQAEQSSFAFTLPNFILSTSNLDLSASTTGASSTADVIYTISLGSGSASISNSILSPIGVGSISISAISPEDANYLGASAVAVIHIIDALPPAFTLATTSITLTKNAPNIIRHIVAITDIVADNVIINQQATFSITRAGDDIFTFSPEPVVSFATNSIQTSTSLNATPTSASLYFSIAPDTIGSASLIIILDKANGQDSSKTLIITVQDSNTIPIISIADSRITNFSVFGGHAYVTIGDDNYNNLLNAFDAEGGYLARIESGTELLHIRGLFPGNEDRFYLGANDIASEGDWVYTNDGVQFGVDTNPGAGGFVVYPGFFNIFAFGPSNQPNNVSNADCLNLMSDDIDCNSLLGGVFEFSNGFPATSNLGRVNIPFGTTSPTIIANLLGFDLDGDETVWSATDSGAGGNIDIIGITSSIVDISYQLAPDFHGNITLTINLNEVGLTNGASAVVMINVVNPTPALVAPSAQVLLAGEPVELTIVNNGGVPTTFDITPALPASLSINVVGNIVISGIPIIAQQSTTYTLSTSNAVGTNTISFVISVNVEPLNIVGGDITANYGDDAISITSQGGNPAQPITWASSIPTVATIDENSGVVTIINIGTTTITASRGSSQASISLLVNPRQLGLSVDPNTTLVFNNTNQTIAVSLTNAVESDINSGAISLTISGDQTAINAGNYQFSVSISGSASPNYIFSPTTISWVVAPAEQSELNITSNATRLMVGQTTIATATNDQPQGTLTITSSEAGIATINASTITATNVGITTITITKQVANYNNISASYQLLVIQNTTTPIDAGDDRIATYIPNGILSPQIPTNVQDRVISYAVDPIASDVVTIDSNSGAITIINVGTVNIIASAATTTNYAASTDSYLLTINQATQGTFTITASDTLTFGTTSAIVIVEPGSGDGTITYAASPSGIIIIDTNGIISTTGVGEAIITATRDGGRNYLNTSATHSLIVERADQANFVISGSSTLANAQTSFATATGGSGTGAIVFSSSNPDIATITQDGIINAQSLGTTTISATKSGGDNYHDISDSYLLTITNTTPTVANLIPNQIASLGNLFTFPIPANTFNDANGDTLTISISALPDGIMFDSTNISITGTPVTVGVSDITVTADDGNGAMVSTSFSLTVSGDFIIVGSNLRNVVYGAASQNIIAQGGVSPAGAVTFASSTPSVANFGDTNIGELTISSAGTAIITATRDGTGEQASISIIVSPRTITPTFASPQTFIYNTNIRTVLATITNGIVGTDDVSLSISGTATATDVGNYNIDLTLTGAASRNYRLSTTTLSWSIIKADQSQFSLGADTTIIFGESLSRPATGVSATVASSYGSSDPDVATVDINGNITTTGIGSTIISTTNTGDNNYNSAADSYTLNVAPLTLTIAIGSTTTIYTGAAITITTTITNLVSGYEQVSLTINGDQTATNAGDYSFDISAIEGSDSPNYILIPTTISWVVAPARQSELDITGNATRLMVGQTTTATATNDQPQGTLTIISSEAGIATINGSTITATNVGITTITITKQVANHNNISASYQLVVIQNTTAAIDAGDNRTATYVPSGTLSAQVPTNTRGRVISYAVDPIASDVATININTGAITITNAGTVNIIVSAAATTNYATSTDSYLLTINQANQGSFTITTSATLIFGATSAIVVVDPGSGEGTITYAASPSGIITIDVNGIISAIGVGEATITATKAGGRNYNDISTSASLEVVTDFNLDIDGDSNRLTTTDGILIIRFLTGSTDTIDTTDATTTDAQRNAQQILKFLQRGYDSLDIDGNGAIEANSDGMLIMRYLADQENLNVGDLVGNSPTRSGAEAISNYLESIYQ